MTFNTDQRDARRGGFYWMDGLPYPSVTNILKVIDKPALRYWFGREVYIAMSKDPTMDEKKALAAPYVVTDAAKDRGSTIHSLVEAYVHSKAHIESLPEKFKGYGQAFFTWINDYGMDIVEHEKTVISKINKYAGTLDMVAKNKKDNWIIDVKTGKDIYDEAHLQISAYTKAFNENITDPDLLISRGGVLLLMENGKYKFATTSDVFEYFMAAKKLWEWQNRELLEKFGYYRK